MDTQIASLYPNELRIDVNGILCEQFNVLLCDAERWCL